MKRATRVLQERGAVRVPRLALRVIGAKREMARLPERGRFNVGGDASNDLVLEDPYASGFQAYFEITDAGRVLLHDRASTNGTFVNGARAISVEVERGARIRIGKTCLVVVDAEADRRSPGSAQAAAQGNATAWRMIGSSPGLQRTLELIERAAPSRAHVLVRGESGSGKELVARQLHESSPRAQGPFVVVNCGAIARGLVESEFFGHERGAFTGATERRAGVFELAHQGTLFLDEVGELPLAQQPGLLRVLETHRVRRVGGEEERQVDVRVVAATHRDLMAEVAGARFRLDLYHRLSMLMIEVPPLRDRPDDIEALARHFLADEELELGSRQLAPDAFVALRRYHWPGNVRELRNAIMRAATLSDGLITAADLLGDAVPMRHRQPSTWILDEHAAVPRPVPPEHARELDDSLDPSDDDPLTPSQQLLAGYDERCRDIYLRTLAETGSIRVAAARLGVPKSTFADRVKRLGLMRMR